MTCRYNPFNKITGNKKTVISKTSEREFEREVKKIESLQESSIKIQESIKRCIKSQSAQAKCEVDLVHSLQGNSAYKEDELLRKLVDEWSRSVKHLEIQTDELNSISSKAIVEPMRKFSTIFPSIQHAIKKREQSLQEYTKCQEKVEKYLKRERTGPNAVKLENNRKACASAKLDFENQNFLLLSEVPQLYEGRVPYFQPSLQAFVKAQVMYYNECEGIYTNLSKHLHDSESELPPDSNDLKLSVQQKLSEIRSLSIAVDDQMK